MKKNKRLERSTQLSINKRKYSTYKNNIEKRLFSTSFFVSQSVAVNSSLQGNSQIMRRQKRGLGKRKTQG